VTVSATERAADYHADHGDRPSLSSSIARLLVQKTPAHAKAEHPKLTDTPVRRESPATDMGTAVHQLLLRDDRVDVIPFDSFRTSEARILRDASRAAGRVPLLPHQWDEAQEIAARVRDQMALLNVEPTPFTHGEPEHVIRFQMGGADCRAMLDWLHNDRLLIDDLKTTTDASPRFAERHLFNMGYDIRAAFYVRAVEAEYGVTPGFRWIFAETKPPYPVSILELDPEAMAAAHDKVDAAVALWNECLASGEWPAYSRELHTVQLPPWLRDKWADVDVDESVPF